MIYKEPFEEGFDATGQNQSVISIGSYHAKQSSQYQSFNINDDNYYNFTQLSTYSPNIRYKQYKNNINSENRIETMKEMLSTPKYKKFIPTYSPQNSSQDDDDDDDYDDNEDSEETEEGTVNTDSSLRILP